MELTSCVLWIRWKCITTRTTSCASGSRPLRERLRPKSFVLVAGYGDCGMSYIGGDRIYTDRGGCEQTYAFSGLCELLLLATIDQLLEGK